MDERTVCRGCGNMRPNDAPSGLCPACLLKAGLLGDGSAIPDVTITFGPASTSVLARFGEAFGQIPPVLLRDADSITDPGPVIRPSSPEVPIPADRSARLQLFGEIARGGMGAVLKGRDSDLGRDLAVKVLLDSHRDKPEMVRRFVEEAQIAGQLQHPGIVPIYELGAFGDRRPYFAMKLVKGHTLAEILSNRKQPGDGLPRFLSIFESICQTMAYAHARGVIHRDLKPSNVMVGSFGEVQVMDWGLAKVLPRGGVVDDASAGRPKDDGTIIATARSGTDSDQSQAGSVMGTPSYMAPEQARGEVDHIDERADVFALGSIFCELLTGEPAFTGRNSGEIQRKAARGELTKAFARLDDETQGHDPELVALAKACLAPEPDDRPRHAGEVADRMARYHAWVQERFRQSEIDRAEQRARAEEATKRAAVERDRSRLTMALAASIVGLMVMGGGGWTYLARQRSARQASTERVVTEAIDRANLLRGQAKMAHVGDLARWSDTLAAVKQARSSMEAGEPTADLRSRVLVLLAMVEKEQAEAAHQADEQVKDRKFFDRLDAIRVESVEKTEFTRIERIDASYATAFREFGVDVDRLEPRETARFLKQRTNPQEFASRLDDWTLIRKAATDGNLDKDHRPWKRLIAAAKAADDDPWRNSLRDLIEKGTPEAKHRLASDENELSRQPARSLYLLSRILRDAQDDDNVIGPKQTTEILKRAWRISPDDYQICRKLGVESASERDRLRFSTAAVAARPESANARTGLAAAFLPLRAMDPPSWTVDKSHDGTFMTEIAFFEKNTKYRKFYKIPRFKFTPHKGPSIMMGPVWDCDLETIPAEKLDAAITEYQAAIRLAPQDASIHMGLAKILVLRGKYDDAFGESQIAARIDPNCNLLESRLPHTFYLKGEFDRAIELLKHGVQRDPSIDAYQFLGMIYHEQGKKSLAFAAYREAFLRAGEGDLDFGDIYWLTETGDLDEVISLYRSAIEAHPQRVGLYRSLAGLFEREGKIAESIAVYRAGIKAHPNDIDLHDNLATNLEREGETDESRAERERMIVLLRDQLRTEADFSTRCRLANLYLSRDQRQEALAQFRLAIDLVPRSLEFYNTIAWDLATFPNRKYRDGKIAIEFATKACELTEWKSAPFLDTLAAAHAESSDFESAVKWQTKAIDLLSDEKRKEDYRTRLKLYQEKKPYHVEPTSG